MLDEPTNHLDMHSCDLLIDSLNKYQGSLILVSHDRYFISKTANKIWEIVDHEIKSFDGGYEEYVEWKERMAKVGRESGGGTRESFRQTADSKATNGEAKSQNPGQALSGQAVNHKEQSNKPQPAAPINKEAKKELQKQQRLFQQLEGEIASQQKKKSELEAALTSPEIYSDKQKFTDAEIRYKKAVDELARMNREYETIFEKIMDLESQG